MGENGAIREHSMTEFSATDSQMLQDGTADANTPTNRLGKPNKFDVETLAYYMQALVRIKDYHAFTNTYDIEIVNERDIERLNPGGGLRKTVRANQLSDSRR